MNTVTNKKRKGGQKVPKIRDFDRVTALYERLSKDDEQQGESNSILNQKRFLEDFARKSGMTNIKHFTDDGYTGRNFNRPGFQAMLAEAEAGKIGTIIVKDMSRFGRNYLEVGFYTEILFPKKQIRFVAINNSVDSDKPQDNDFTPFLNIMNEWYAKDTSNKIKSIFLSRMNDGKRCSGSIPYGYNRLPEDKQTLVVDPVASQVVKHMHSAYVQTKEKAEHTTHPEEHSAEEYASDRVEGGVDRIAHEAAHQFDKQGRRGLEETKRNMSKARDGVQKFKEKRAAESLKRQTVRTSGNKTIKALEPAEKTIKQSARSAGKKTIKTAEKSAAKTAQKSVKATKTAIKTTQQAAKAAQKTAQATVKATQRAAQAAKATAKATVAGVKAAVKATIAAVKAIIAATKALVAAIAAGGWIAVVVIIVLCLIGLICGSVFGVFFSGEDSGTGMSMQTAVQEINANYDSKLEAEKSSVSYDDMEISGGRAVWKDVLAVYAVKTNTDKDNPQEVATMDESKKQILSDIFWEMNSISSRSESHSEMEITETDDGNGNIVQTETTVTKTTLYITVSHKTVEEMADLYGFDAEQREYLAELLKDENNSIWAAVLYGIRYSDDQIVTVALSQVGNVGGQPYWSWYGFGSRVEWCACFVSWCANECGYIDTGVIPKFAGCVNGVQWFKDRGQWIDGSAEPVPGMIIFFDWDNKGHSGPQDGQSDHVGIVQKVENGIVYTVEGNSGDSCRVNQYSVGHYEILGYGVPQY